MVVLLQFTTCLSDYEFHVCPRCESLLDHFLTQPGTFLVVLSHSLRVSNPPRLLGIKNDVMNTPSHWLINVSLSRILLKRKPKLAPLPKWAVGLGAVAPDIALAVLGVGGMIYYRQILGWPSSKAGRHMFKDLFYNDPFWITCHNFLHSPTMLLMLLGLAFWMGKQWSASKRVASISRFLKWFLLSCMCHTVVDIVTHFDDGPLLFFPFDFHYRFSSPISYWDAAHHAREFRYFEVALDLTLVAWLVVTWWRKRAAKNNS